jgi:hypothetical protein
LRRLYRLAVEVERVPGLDGEADPQANKVLGKIRELEVRVRYAQLQLKRKRI